MKPIRRALALICLLISFAVLPALAQQTVTVSALVQHASQYDGKVISVVGTVTAYRERVSARGNPYTTFRLADSGVSVSVLAWKYQGLHNALRARVLGTFAKVRHEGPYTFYNEIQAQRIEVIQSTLPGPTALCNDGTYSYAAHHQGACSHHGGVAQWYK